MTLTGLPIQLVRGLLAAALAVMMWSVWGRLQTVAVGSNLYTAYLQRHFLTTLAALAVIFAGGWALTNFLGDIYKENIQTEAQGDLNLLVSRLDGETATVDAMVKALSGSRAVHSLLTGGGEAERAQTVLGRNVEASGATLGQILDLSGAVIASSDRESDCWGHPMLPPHCISGLRWRVGQAVNLSKTMRAVRPATSQVIQSAVRMKRWWALRC